MTGEMKVLQPVASERNAGNVPVTDSRARRAFPLAASDDSRFLAPGDRPCSTPVFVVLILATAVVALNWPRSPALASSPERDAHRHR